MAPPTKVPTTRTPVALEQLIPPLVRAFYAATGEMPEPVDVAIVFGKKVAENGWPGPNETTWCFNIGNVRGVSPSGLYCVLKGAWELARAADVGRLLLAGYVVLDPPPPQAKVTAGMVCVLPPPEKQGFRAYRNLDDACADYVRVLGTNFKRTWQELRDHGTDPAEFVDAMKADRYFTGDVSAYKRNALAGVSWALPKVAALLASTAIVVGDDSEPDTLPDSPSGKSSQTLQAVREPIAILDGPATPLRAGEGEHTVKPEDVEL